MKHYRIISDGTGFGTRIEDAATGEVIEGVISARWSVRANGIAQVELEMDALCLDGVIGTWVAAGGRPRALDRVMRRAWMSPWSGVAIAVTYSVAAGVVERGWSYWAFWACAACGWALFAHRGKERWGSGVAS